jgi:hypothetical protein
MESKPSKTIMNNDNNNNDDRKQTTLQKQELSPLMMKLMERQAFLREEKKREGEEEEEEINSIAPSRTKTAPQRQESESKALWDDVSPSYGDFIERQKRETIKAIDSEELRKYVDYTMNNSPKVMELIKEVESLKERIREEEEKEENSLAAAVAAAPSSSTATTTTTAKRHNLNENKRELMFWLWGFLDLSKTSTPSTNNSSNSGDDDDDDRGISKMKRHLIFEHFNALRRSEDFLDTGSTIEFVWRYIKFPFECSRDALTNIVSEYCERIVQDRESLTLEHIEAYLLGFLELGNGDNGDDTMLAAVPHKLNYMQTVKLQYLLEKADYQKSDMMSKFYDTLCNGLNEIVSKPLYYDNNDDDDSDRINNVSNRNENVLEKETFEISFGAVYDYLSRKFYLIFSSSARSSSATVESVTSISNKYNKSGYGDDGDGNEKKEEK